MNTPNHICCTFARARTHASACTHARVRARNHTRARTRIFDSAKVYPCDTDNCQGGTGTHGLCREGSTGPLCGQCKAGYFLRDASHRCARCSVENAWLGPVIVTVLLSCVGTLVYRFRETLSTFCREKEDVLTDAGHRVTVVFITMQIILMLTTNHEV